MTKKLGILYINGLGNGKTKLKEKLAMWWWRRAGLDIQHAHIDWYDDGSLGDKIASVEKRVNEMLRNCSGVVIIGSSAGGSLAINSYYRLHDKNVCAVSAHGRLKTGDYPDSHRMSLYHRAHLDTKKPSQSFFDSVMMTETQVTPNLTEQDKKRLLILTQLTDLVVPMETMSIEGIQQHRSITFGHSGGFIAHLLVNRSLIADFSKNTPYHH